MQENGCGPCVRGAGKSYVWPEGGIDAWLENKRAAREEAITRHPTMGQVPIWPDKHDDQVSDD